MPEALDVAWLAPTLRRLRSSIANPAADDHGGESDENGEQKREVADTTS